MPKHTSGMCTAKDIACIWRAASMSCCEGRPSAPVRSWAARSVACIRPCGGRPAARADNRRHPAADAFSLPPPAYLIAHASHRDLHPSRPDAPGRAPHSRGLRGVPAARHAVGASAPVPQLWPRRLLRFVARPPRAPARASDRPPDRPVLRARRGLALVLLRRDLRLSVDDGTPAAAVADALVHHADRDRSLADGGGHALDRAAAHVPGREDAGEAGLEHERSLLVIRAGAGTGEDIAARVERDARAEPARVGL